MHSSMCYWLLLSVRASLWYGLPRLCPKQASERKIWCSYARDQLLVFLKLCVGVVPIDYRNFVGMRQ